MVGSGTNCLHKLNSLSALLLKFPLLVIVYRQSVLLEGVHDTHLHFMREACDASLDKFPSQVTLNIPLLLCSTLNAAPFGRYSFTPSNSLRVQR